MPPRSAVVSGTTISPGVAFGFVIRDRMLEALDADPPAVPSAEVERQVGRLDDAIRRVRATLAEHVAEEHGPSEVDRNDIIAAHLLMLDDGHLIVHPTARQRATAEQVPTRARSRRRRSLGPLPIDLEDGSTLHLHGNIDHPSQVGLCLEQRLSGVGLFRTEFLVLEAGRVPGEEEQVARYRGVFEGLGSLPIVIRTFDLGGDKTVSGLHRCTGPNPALGVRGLRRHILRHPEELRSQLRAILRAANGHRVGVLLPMVTGAADITEARALLDATRNELIARDEPFNTETRLGAMIEVPSAALTLGEILPLVDFVSIGTNDLLQYLTASDRNNEEVLRYQVAETSGLRTLLELVVATARSNRRVGDVAVCGELASTPEGARFLVELGIRSLSVLPSAAPAIRRTLVATARSST